MSFCRVRWPWRASWPAVLGIGLLSCLTAVHPSDALSTSGDSLQKLDEALTQIEQGLNMIGRPLSEIERNLSLREERLQQTAKALDSREQELNVQEQDLTKREASYGALLVEVSALKEDLEAAHAHGMRLLAWGAGGGLLIGALVVFLVGGM